MQIPKELPHFIKPSHVKLNLKCQCLKKPRFSFYYFFSCYSTESEKRVLKDWLVYELRDDEFTIKNMIAQDLEFLMSDNATKYVLLHA